MRTKFLQTVLTLDAVTCAATGGLLTVAAGPLAALTGLPDVLLLEAGLFLLPFAAFAYWAGRQLPRTTRPTVAVAIANILWVAGSAAVIAGPWIAPNLLGTAFVAVQAAAVAGLTAFELYGLAQADGRRAA